MSSEGKPKGKNTFRPRLNASLSDETSFLPNCWPTIKKFLVFPSVFPIKLCVYNENHFPEVEKEDYVLPEEPKERQNGPPSTSSKVFKNSFFLLNSSA